MTTSYAVLGQFGDAIRLHLRGRDDHRGHPGGRARSSWTCSGQHLKLTFAAMGVACAIAVPLGLWLGHIRRASFLAISVSNVGRAVPSLALIAFFVAYLGRGLRERHARAGPARHTADPHQHLRGRDAGGARHVDSARGMGMTGAEIVRKVELPLALPLIFGGIKTSAVNVLATATIAPLAGINTLGDPIINVSGYGDTGRLAAAIVVAAPRHLHGASPRRCAARRDARGAEARIQHRVTAHETPFREGSHDMRRHRITAGLITVLLVLATFAIAACGDDDNDSSDSGDEHDLGREVGRDRVQPGQREGLDHDGLEELHRAEGPRRDLRPGPPGRRLQGQEGAEPG